MKITGLKIDAADFAEPPALDRERMKHIVYAALGRSPEARRWRRMINKRLSRRRRKRSNLGDTK